MARKRDESRDMKLWKDKELSPAWQQAKKKIEEFDRDRADQMKDIPLMIRRIREIRGWSQEKVARYLNVSFPTVNAWERGISQPFARHYRKIVDLHNEVIAESKRFNVFIVEDDEDSALVLHEYVKLALPNWSVQHFKDGTEALLKIGTYKPLIVLLDIMMPGLDGIEVFKKIRKIEELKDCRILFITAVTDEAVLRRAHEVKPFALIQKPYEKEVLVQLLKDAAGYWV
ncbi:MAG: response regulator [Lentisphaerae bacterium]|nr:MAG: response regulator [Lentisphaerota bacterium]